MDYRLIETKEALEVFVDENQQVEWLAFDTEFVGEKRYYTQLCLVQVATPNGLYLIDPLKVQNLRPFLTLLEDPKILKITHAGENDYKLLHTLYNAIPQNIIDTQIAAGFADYKYPISFGRLASMEANMDLEKGFAATDWEKRPFSKSQIKYALNDVIPLKQMWDSLREKIEARGRLDWVKEECEVWTTEAYYQVDPNKEILKNRMFDNLSNKSRLFLMRLLRWRTNRAKQKNYSLNQILHKKNIAKLVKTIPSGVNGLRQNRLLPKPLVDNYGELFVSFYTQAPNEEEASLLKQINGASVIATDEKMMVEFIYLLFVHHCNKNGISADLIISKNGIIRLKTEKDERDALLNCQWKKEFLGQEFIEWMLNYDSLSLDVNGGTIQIQHNKA